MVKFLLKQKQYISIFYKYCKQNIASLCVTPQKWYSTIKQLQKNIALREDRNLHIPCASKEKG